MDDIIVKQLLFKGDSYRLSRQWKTIINENIDIYNYLINRYDDSDSIEETLYRLKHNIEVKPICRYCKKPIIFNIKSNKFPDICGSKNCIKLKVENTSLQRYGVTNVSFLDTTKTIISTKLKNKTEHEKEQITNKRKHTCQEKYGVDNCFQSDDKKNKIKQTCLEKYGVTNGGGSKEAIQKIKQTKLKRYGNAYYINSEKYKKTCLERYGVDNYRKTEECKDKIAKITWEHYHSYNYTQSELYKENLEYYTDKRFKTLSINNGFKFISNKEQEIANWLICQGYNIQQQYKDKLRYPFNCDIYIQDFDIFIEYQGSQFHNKHPFDPNNINDLIILEQLKVKAKLSKRHKEGKESQYDKMIETWTVRDVKKRNIAKENKLNYIEIWPQDNYINIIDNYINKIKNESNYN